MLREEIRRQKNRFVEDDLDGSDLCNILAGMAELEVKETKSRFPFIYEIAVWLFYTSFYKYDYYLGQVYLKPDPEANFPHLQVMLFAITMTLYIVPYYKWILPLFLHNKKYLRLAALSLLYFMIIPKINNWVISYTFVQFNQQSELTPFFEQQYRVSIQQITHIIGWDLRILFTDIIAFSSIAITGFAFKTEQKKHLLERDNLKLQLESLKTQLNPHFLFNNLNSIYSMSITGREETHGLILRLSDMMRYILYDCSHNKVTLEKDLEFLENYFEMEKQRYPGTAISLRIKGDTMEKSIAPLLLIPFAENAFKHGAHRVNGNGYVTVQIEINGTELIFICENDIVSEMETNTVYGGVGIKNVKQRLDLYYPGENKLEIIKDKTMYRVKLFIDLKRTL